MPPIQDRSPPLRNDAAIVFFTVLIVIVVLFALAFYMVSLVDQAFQGTNEREEFPHGLSGTRDINPTRTSAIPAPVSFEVMGNATGTQHLLVLDKTGVLTVYTSNDLFTDNLTEAHLTRLEANDLSSFRLELGHIPNGSIAVHVIRGSFDRYWIQQPGNDSFQEVEGPLTLTVQQRPMLDEDDLPASDRIRDYNAGWNTIHLDGHDVMVAEFSDSGGCLVWSYCPGVAYRMPNGQWSNIVVLDETSPDGISIAGTSMDDMFVVTWEEDRTSVYWWFYPVKDDSVMEAGTPVKQG